jgi:hypothetical protein
LATDAVKSAYEGLKAIIHRKWGADAPISSAINAVEKDPQSKAQAAVLEEKVAGVQATQDTEVLRALHQLVEQLKASGASNAVSHIQFNMSGGLVQGVAGSSDVHITTMNFNAPPKP